MEIAHHFTRIRIPVIRIPFPSLRELFSRELNQFNRELVKRLEKVDWVNEGF